MTINDDSNNPNFLVVEKKFKIVRKIKAGIIIYINTPNPINPNVGLILLYMYSTVTPNPPIMHIKQIKLFTIFDQKLIGLFSRKSVDFPLVTNQVILIKNAKGTVQVNKHMEGSLKFPKSHITNDKTIKGVT